MSYCFGSLVMTGNKKYYYTLLVEPLIFGIYAGVESINKKGVARLDDSFLKDTHLKDIFSDDKEGGGLGIGYKSKEVGFMVDMENKKLYITDHQCQKVKKILNFPWSNVSPIVYFKNKVSITIAKSELKVPSWIM